MTLHYLTKSEKPEPLSITEALERSIAQAKAKQSAEAARAVDEKRWAESEKHKAWIAGCRKAIADGRIKMRETRAAMAAARAEHDRAIDDTLNAYVCLVEALDGSNEFKNEFGHQVPKGKSK